MRGGVARADAAAGRDIAPASASVATDRGKRRMVPREERREAARTDEDERTDAPERAGRSGARAPTPRNEGRNGRRRSSRAALVARSEVSQLCVRVVRASRAVRRGSFDRASRSVARAFPTPETVSNRLFRIIDGSRTRKKKKGRVESKKSGPLSTNERAPFRPANDASLAFGSRFGPERSSGLENDGLENAATPRAPGAARRALS